MGLKVTVTDTEYEFHTDGGVGEAAGTVFRPLKETQSSAQQVLFVTARETVQRAVASDTTRVRVRCDKRVLRSEQRPAYWHASRVTRVRTGLPLRGPSVFALRLTETALHT